MASDERWTVERILNKSIDKVYSWRVHLLLHGAHYEAQIIRTPGNNGQGTDTVLILYQFGQVNQVVSPGTPPTVRQVSTFFGLYRIAGETYWDMDVISNILTVPALPGPQHRH